MRPFSSPDAVLWRYVEMRRRLSTAGNASPRGDEGLFYAKSCSDPECRCKKPTRKLDGTLICSHCGGLWPSEWRVQLPNAYQHSARPQTRDELITDLAQMALIIRQAKLWERRAWEVYVISGGDYADAARILLAMYPRANLKWCPWRVRELVRDARDTVAIYLARVELLAA